ncbi:hypothetical protein MHPYR_60070 [uncultured Mycobacterium sp.]|uniref:Uncharacterized protein n=1 Tax=uncultured Mycobacterium sp. TaxID=171292 RepID=A0A1Y5PIQ4_9MYCO|nr:hypothetical protein MHPYR_60070 [uncultured Mycobacterium sp.]
MTFATRDWNGQQPPSAAARTAMMTAACCAVDSWPHVLLNVAGPAGALLCSSWRNGSTNVVGSPPLPSIHVLEAMQACAYCSSVDSAGTSIRVVTPPGDVPTVPDGEAASVDSCALLDGAGVVDGLCPPPPGEHAASAATPAAAANRERHRYPRMESIYATLAAMTERTVNRECC